MGRPKVLPEKPIRRGARTPVPHIWDKLDRAYQHIIELEGRINAFASEPERTLVHPDLKARDTFFKRFAGGTVPNEFSVIAGEVFYQLRSSLDNLVYSLIRFENPNAKTTSSQFPIFRVQPKDKSLVRYEAQIAGITRKSVRAFIESYQPYRGRHRLWLSVIDSKCNIDKHRTLDIHMSRIQREAVFTSANWQVTSYSPDDGTEPFIGCDPSVDGVEVKCTFSTFVAFEEWGGNAGANFPIVVGLSQAHQGICRIIQHAEKYLRRKRPALPKRLNSRL